MSPKPTDLLAPTPQGLHSALGGFHVDAMRPAERVLVTHGHADHARAGHGAVLATAETLAIMATRYGADFAGSTQVAPLGQPLRIGDVTVTFLPAGHVLGSAQILVEAGGLRVLFTGDYKRARDPTCLPFEPAPCHVFITEATFGLPVFRHPPAAGEARKLLRSAALFPERAHVVGAYALGKAQRVMAHLREEGYERPIYVHGAMEKLTALYQAHGVPLGEVVRVAAADRKLMAGEIVICPPSQIQDRWARKLPDPVTAFASGWMRVRGRARMKGVELPLVISDHCDWPELTATILETGAEEVWVTHGAEEALVHWCQSRGLKARPLHLVGYGDEGEAERGEGEAALEAVAEGA